MAKYKAGDEFKLRAGEDTVNRIIIFVPPVDGKGEQYYLCKVTSLDANSQSQMYLHLQKEEKLEQYYEPRELALSRER